MKLLFQYQEIQFEKSLTVEKVMEKVKQLLGDKYYFSHFIANGVEMYEDLEQYLEINLYSIQELRIISKTVREFVNDLLLTAEDYLVRAIPEISLLTHDFYQNPTSESWNKFTQLLDGIQWLIQMTQSINSVHEKPGKWMTYLKRVKLLENELKVLGEAVGNNDNILIADLLLYEILPI